MKKDFNNILPPDPEQFWPDAEKMLDQHFRQKRRNKRVVVFLFAGIGLLLSTYFYSRFSANIPPVLTQENSSVEASKSFDNINSNIPNHKTVSGNDAGKENFEKKSQNSTVKKLHESKSDLSPITNTGSKSTQDVYKNSNPYITGKPQAKDAITLSKTETETKYSVPTPVNSPDKLSENNLVIPDKNSDQSTYSSTVQSFSSIPLLQTLPDKEVYVSGKEKILRLKEPTPLTPEVNINSGLNLEVALYASMNSISKSLQADEMTEYLARRRNEELSVIAPAAGVSFLVNKNNLSASLGVEYSYWGEKTQYESYSQQTQYTTNGSWNQYYRTVTDTDTAFITGIEWFIETQVSRLDSSYSSYTDTSIVNVYDPTVSERNGTNKFYYVEIPLIVSYRYALKRYGLGFSLGVSPAWLTSEKGYYLKEDLSGVESVSESKPLKTFILNGRFSLDLSYQLNPRLNILLSPQVKTNLSPISNSNQVLKQRYTAAGINFGIAYKLN